MEGIWLVDGGGGRKGDERIISSDADDFAAVMFYAGCRGSHG